MELALYSASIFDRLNSLQAGTQPYFSMEGKEICNGIEIQIFTSLTGVSHSRLMLAKPV